MSTPSLNGQPQPSAANGNIDQPLAEAVSAAQLLLEYVAEQGIGVSENTKGFDETIIDTIVKTKHILNSRPLDDNEECQFWHAYRQLCSFAAPVSRESLEATNCRKEGLKEVSVASSAVRRYQLLTVVAIATLLLFQVYWVFLSSLVSNSSQINEELTKREAAEYRKHPQLITDEETAESTTDTTTETSDQNTTTADNNPKWDYRYDPGYIELVNKWTANIALLQKIDLVGRAFSKTESDTGNAVYTTNANSLDNDNLRREIQMVTGAISLNILSLYILPILYGLVGACAYILRTMSEQIRSRTFTRDTRIRLQLSLVLGALAGFSIAWFVGGEGTSSIIKNVAPLALAFLGGYSVELLFSAMDTIVEAFTKKEKAA